MATAALRHAVDATATPSRRSIGRAQATERARQQAQIIRDQILDLTVEAVTFGRRGAELSRKIARQIGVTEEMVDWTIAVELAALRCENANLRLALQEDSVRFIQGILARATRAAGQVRTEATEAA